MRPPTACSLRRLLVWLCASLALASASAASAGADVFGPISLLSASPFEQFEYAHNPAISGNGRFVVFEGSVGDVTGVWLRENRPGGALEQVAGGDAELPSISQSGQYVSFTTNEGAKLGEITAALGDAAGALPDPEHATHEAPNVYVRNMAKEPNEAGAFVLASPLSYEYHGSEETLEAEEEGLGAEAAGRTALSANGQKVVFVTTASSDLDGPETPPLQVAVRDLETGTTELVSVEDERATGKPLIENGEPKPVPAISESDNGAPRGAVYTIGGPPEFGPTKPYSLAPGVGASISADGSTVAWMGQNLGDQVRTLPEEELPPKYSEPLWRKIGNGEQTPTRRVTGGSDPENPLCAQDPEGKLPFEAQESLSDPCQGPFMATVTERNYGIWALPWNPVPALSEHGEEVAFLANQPLLALGSDFGLGSDPTDPSDIYIANMSEGLTRTQALRPLTELASGNTTIRATDAPILELAVSPDGGQVAFTTERTIFPLGSPAYVSAPAAVPGMSELFDVDLGNDTLTRVTRGYEGGPSEAPHREKVDEDEYESEFDGALAPSFSDGGDLLAFSSTAANLVYGDGNTPPLSVSNVDGSDAFVSERIQFGSTPAVDSISPAPANPAPQALWSLGVSAQSLANGEVMLYVEVPGAGTLSATASSSVRIAGSRAARRATHKAHGARAARPTVQTRAVAAARRLLTAEGSGFTTLLLKLAHSYTSLAGQHGGLSAQAVLTFTAPGHPAVHQHIALTFVRRTPVRSARAGAAHRSKVAKGGTR